MWELIKNIEKFVITPFGYEKELTLRIQDLKSGILKSDEDVLRYIELFATKRKCFKYEVIDPPTLFFTNINKKKLELVYETIEKENKKHSDAYQKRSKPNIIPLEGKPKLKDYQVTWGDKCCPMGENTLMYAVCSRFLNEDGVYESGTITDNEITECVDGKNKVKGRSIESAVRALNKKFNQFFNAENFFLWKKQKTHINSLYF